MRAIDGEGIDDRPSSPSKRPKVFARGDRLEARYKGGNKWFKGKVSYVTEDRCGDVESYDIKYEDGDSEQNVAPENVRAIDGEGSDEGSVES